MQDLQDAFLADVPRRIQILREDLTRLANSSFVEQPEVIGKLFRHFHTLKGSAAAYGLSAASRIAHQLENFLEIINRENFSESIRVLREGVEEIEAALYQSGGSGDGKIEDWQAVYEKARLTGDTREQIRLPFDLDKKLNAKETGQLRRALKIYPSLAIIRVGFAIQNFTTDFLQIRRLLSEFGEIAATLPDAEKTNSEEIALRLILVCRERDRENIVSSLHNSEAEISEFWSCSNDDGRAVPRRTKKVKISNLWAQAVLAGKQTAAKFGKTVEFLTRGDADLEIEGELAEACETALLHIARNAAAHGIETPEERRANGKSESGAVCLEISLKNDELSLQITDDGRGIDLEKVWRQAKRRNLIAENTFDKEIARRIIFLPGFSTAAAVTEDAGRGIGLDAVQTAIQAANGTIEVSSRTNRGTKFSIRFPIGN